MSGKGKKTVKIAAGGTELPVWLMDGTKIKINFEPGVKAGQTCVAIRDHLGFAMDGEYALFHFHDGYHELLEDSADIAAVTSGWNYEDVESGKRKLAYKRRSYTPECVSEEYEDRADDVDDWQHKLAFIDAEFNYLNGMYRFAADTMVDNAAHLLQAGKGDWDESIGADDIESWVMEIFPSYGISDGDRPQDERTMGDSEEAMTKADAAAQVLDAWSALAGTSALEAQQAFLKNCKEFMSYGAEFFFGKRTWKDSNEDKANQKVRSRTEDVTIAVCHEGLHLLSMENPLQLEAHEYEVITRWTVSRDGRIFAFSVDEDVIVYLVTEQAAAIEKNVERYVQHVVSVRGGTKPEARASRGKVPSVTGVEEPEEPAYKSGAAGAGGGGDSDLPPGWVAETDEDGDVYYTNEETGETQWERPGEEGAGEELEWEGWTVQYDEDGDAYYLHEESGETSWEPPEGWPHGGGAEGEDEELESWGDWRQEKDEDGDIFYINDETGETSWETPEGWGE
jgi:hypothetical protein